MKPGQENQQDGGSKGREAEHIARRWTGALLGLCLFGVTVQTQAQTALPAQVVAYSYDGQGNLIKEVVQPEGAVDECLVTLYTYDVRGNRETATQRMCDGNEGRSFPSAGEQAFAPRTITTFYGDAYKRLPTRITNAAGHLEDRTYDYRFGTLTQQTETSNGTQLYIAAQYDGFGRQRLTIRKDRTREQIDYQVLATGSFAVRTTPQDINGAKNGAQRSAIFDGLGREVRTETEGMDGRLIYTQTEYDEAGRVASKTRPYYAGQSLQRSVIQYDPLDRILYEETLDGKVFTHEFYGLVEHLIDIKGQRTVMQRNHLGQLIQVTDALSSQLTYRYDKFGNLYNTIDAHGNVVSVAYTVRGARKSISDPDMGAWQYRYNALGELVWQQDARGNATTLIYDALGRLKERREADLISTWFYDRKEDGSLCGPSIGRLCEAKADNGYRRTLGYDNYGRTTNTALSVDGRTLSTQDSYDPTHGRLASQTYPSGLQVVYGYNGLGYLTQVGNSSGTTYWTALERDAEQHLRQQRFGNNTVTEQTYDGFGRIKQILVGPGGGVQNLAYQYEAGTGNLLVREDRNQALIESLGYDALNRLSLSTVNASAVTPAQTTRFGYDRIGNLVCKSDLGTCDAANPNLFYGATSADGRRLPHAVGVVGGTVHGFTNPGYQYDANGNFTAGAGRMASWKSFNMPHVLERPGTYRAEFLYGPEHQRVKQLAVGGGVTRTLYYLHPDQANGLLYELETFGSTTTHNHYINAGGENVALVKLEGGVWTTQYMHRDNLGSVTTITDAAGSVAERLAYDAWGKRRFAQGTADTNDTLHADPATRYLTDRGYTNHEMLDELGMIHMNGRIYDPVIARFTSPDPNVTNPKWMQTFNRYTYVDNNPFAYTDPTGYEATASPTAIEGASQSYTQTDKDGKSYDTYTGLLTATTTAQQASGYTWEQMANKAGLMPERSDPTAPLTTAETLAITTVQQAFNEYVDTWGNRGVSIAGSKADIADFARDLQVSPSSYSLFNKDRENQRKAQELSLIINPRAMALYLFKQLLGVIRGSPLPELPLLPDSYWINRKAPDYMTPGVRTVNDPTKPSSAGGSYHSTTHYDEYGRLIGQTHRTDHGRAQDHPDPHHHRRDPVTGEKLKSPDGSRAWPGLFGN